MENSSSAGGAKPEGSMIHVARMVLLVYMFLAPLLGLLVVFLLKIDLWPKIGLVTAIGAGLILLGLLNLYLYSKKGK